MKLSQFMMAATVAVAAVHRAVFPIAVLPHRALRT